MAEQHLQREQRVEFGIGLGFALQEPQHGCGEGMPQRVERRRHAFRFGSRREHRADPARFHRLPPTGQEQSFGVTISSIHRSSSDHDGPLLSDIGSGAVDQWGRGINHPRAPALGFVDLHRDHRFAPRSLQVTHGQTRDFHPADTRCHCPLDDQPVACRHSGHDAPDRFRHQRTWQHGHVPHGQLVGLSSAAVSIDVGKEAQRTAARQ